MIFSTAVLAGTCTVPGTHPTIQEAVDDVACTQVDLGDQVFEEDLLINRSVAIGGANPGNSIVQGQIGATGLGSLVLISNLRVENGCGPIGVQSVLGARINGVSFVVANVPGALCNPDFLLIDGFETVMR